MIPHGPVKCKSEINKMKPVPDGLEDQVTERSAMSTLTTSVTCTRPLLVRVSVTKTSSTGISGYKLPWSRGAVENTSPGCWMNQEHNFKVEIKSFFVLLLIILCLFWRSEG